MTVRPLPLLLVLLLPMASLFPAACDAEQDCPEGHETCVCAEDYQCLEGLECLSNRCVGPAGDSGNDSGGTSSDPSSGSNGNNGGNVSACEDFVDSLNCTLPGGDAALSCTTYEIIECDVSPYFDCLADNTSCADGMADLSGWADCASLSGCA